MTRKELASLLGYKNADNSDFQKAISMAKAERPDMAQKTTFDCNVELSFTKEEIECICSHIHPAINELKMQVILENYIDHGVTYIQHRSLYIDGTEKYHELVKRDPKYRSCAICAYCC